MATEGHLCPSCGATIERVHRDAMDRWVSLFRRVHRYRCNSPGCGWHGLLGNDPPSTATRPPELWRVRMIWMMLGVAIALAAGQAVRYHQRTPTDLQRSAPRAAPALSAAVAEGDDFPGVELLASDERIAGNRPALQLRRSCAWGVPGGNPYRGTVEQALSAARLPGEVVRTIGTMVERGWTRGEVEISRSGIRTIDQKRHFDRRMLAMGFGKVLCFDTQVNFKSNHVEYAALYEADDREGKTHTVMIPYVCQNVAVLGERGESEDENGSPGGNVAEPAGWAMALFALGVLAILRRRR